MSSAIHVVAYRGKYTQSQKLQFFREDGLPSAYASLPVSLDIERVVQCSVGCRAMQNKHRFLYMDYQSIILGYCR